MGMDVYGKSPKTSEVKPQIDWETATDNDKEMYFEEMNKWEANNPGVYFRANCWSWRPIHAICDFAIDIAQLSFDTNGWGENSGFGLKTQEECDALANAIELYLELNNGNMHDVDDIIYLCLGGWTTVSGQFMPEEIEDELNQTYPVSTILYNGVVTKNGTLAFSAHSCSLNHINNFVTFLRNCGGFEIW